MCTHTRLHDEDAAHWAVPACAPGASTARRSPAARSRRRVRRLRARARPSVPAAACVAIASVGRSGDGEISGNGTTTMCCWCCGRRDARTAFPQPRTAPSASTPGRSANATRFHSFGSRKVEAEEVRSSRGRERRPAKGRSTTTGNPSSLPTDTCAEPYSSCTTERATQRSPLGTQQGALPDVGPES